MWVAKRDLPQVIVVDAGSLRPLPGAVAYLSLRPKILTKWPLSVGEPLFADTEGRLQWSNGWLAEEVRDDVALLTVIAPGYRALSIEDPFAKLTAEQVVCLLRASQSILSIKQDGVAFTAPVTIKDYHGHVVLAAGLPTREGTIAVPLGPGEQIVVQAGNLSWRGIVTEPVTSVNLPREGRLRVMKPPGLGTGQERIVALADHGRVIQRSGENTQAIEFDSLPSGKYRIVTHDAAEQLSSMLPVAGCSVELQEGETSIIPWSELWRTPGVLRGRVHGTLGENEPLYVVPSFFGPDDPLPIDNISGKRFLIEQDGSYTITGLSGEPIEILVMRGCGESGMDWIIGYSEDCRHVVLDHGTVVIEPALDWGETWVTMYGAGSLRRQASWCGSKKWRLDKEVLRIPYVASVVDRLVLRRGKDLKDFWFLRNNDSGDWFIKVTEEGSSGKLPYGHNGHK